MEIFLIFLLLLLLCLCGIVCTRLHKTNKLLEKLSAAYDVSQKLVQAQHELIENHKKRIAILISVIEN